MPTPHRFVLRLPPEITSWLKAQAEHHSSSMNSEIVRALRERIARVEADG